ncbi:MAG: pilus assembly protein [Deltaproteobacteria bacterium]|nr:pilus assembly protein [Deltaproteobacteria bacterium]
MSVRRRVRRFSRGQRGVAAVELAIIIPVFLLMLFGVLEFGHTWYIQHALTNASREGARYGIVYKNFTTPPYTRMPPQAFTPSIQEVVDGYLLQFFAAKFWEVKILKGGSATTAGSDLEVEVSADKAWFALGGLVPGLTTIKLKATTTMKLE